MGTFAHPLAVGSNQFAYQLKKGARDALLLMRIKVLQALSQDKVLAVYKGDVQGAFDKVSARRLADKMRWLNFPAELR